MQNGATGANDDPAPGIGHQHKLLVRDSVQPPEIQRVLVLQLDHLGDFIIGLPALRWLRVLFPAAHIRLVCGHWNQAAAQDCGLVDEVRTFNFFAERPMDPNDRSPQEDSVFQVAVAGRFDLAVDLRAATDTRYLLERVDASLRCGIGSRDEFAFLDIALPTQRYQRVNVTDPDLGVQYVAPDRFETRMHERTPLYHEADIVFSGRHIVYGPYVHLPLGRVGVAFDVRVTRLVPTPRSRLIIDVFRDDGRVMVAKRFSGFSMARIDLATSVLEFDNDDAEAVYEFRIFVGGRPLSGHIRFAGVRLWQIGVPTPSRFRPAELHVGELLSLLVELIKQRTTDLYAGIDRHPLIEVAALPKAIAHLPRTSKRIVIAPFSNGSIRDWPITSYGTLIELLIARVECHVVIVGSIAQKAESERLAGLCSNRSRLIDLTGTTQWTDLNAILVDADLVVCNNSGVAHQSARLGVATLAIYAGAFQPEEWGPRGRRVRVVMAGVPCSPCGLTQLAQCPYDHLCMRLITPDAVAAHAAELLGENILEVASVTPASSIRRP